MNLSVIRDQAKKRLENLGLNVVDDLVAAKVGNLDWYLKQKIVRPPDDQFRDHARALKYAYVFALRGARVTFVLENAASPTPDLKVDINQYPFWVEVKKFRTVPEATMVANPVERIINVVKGKMRQLISSEINLVAIDNFDLRLESASGLALTREHDHIIEALCELGRLSAQAPQSFARLSGVIFAAQSSGFVSAVNGTMGGPLPIPHFVWANNCCSPPLPTWLIGWVVDALPSGRQVACESGDPIPR